MRKNQHVVPHEGKWAVKSEDKKTVTSVHATQQEAIDAAKKIAEREQGEVVIHGRDGQIRDSDSYGSESSKKDKVH